MNAGFGDWGWHARRLSPEVSRHLDLGWSDYERKEVERVSRMRLSDIPPSKLFFDGGIRKILRTHPILLDLPKHKGSASLVPLRRPSDEQTDCLPFSRRSRKKTSTASKLLSFRFSGATYTNAQFWRIIDRISNKFEVI